nr:MAG TPA: hypothetical protein [Caudoviricetes sp.]
MYSPHNLIFFKFAREDYFGKKCFLSLLICPL